MKRFPIDRGPVFQNTLIGMQCREGKIDNPEVLWQSHSQYFTAPEALPATALTLGIQVAVLMLSFMRRSLYLLKGARE